MMPEIRAISDSQSLITPIVVWQVASLGWLTTSAPTIGMAIISLYEEWFGAVEADYAAYARFAMPLALVAVTAPASMLTVAIHAWNDTRPLTMWRTIATVVLWEALVVLTFTFAFEDVRHAVHNLDWKLFGPSDLYSFRNLLLPRIIAWLMCTVPVSAFVVLLYRYLPRRG